MSVEPILALREVTMSFPVRRGWLSRPLLLRAVNSVTLDVYTGEALGIVGEFRVWEDHTRALHRRRPSADLRQDLSTPARRRRHA
ncbi:MAG: hypothetical protein RML45_03435 [Acetobacteraceae bacterium]|nr:hypothetical protein [Acetobacteraceae bacterium]